MRNRAKCPIRPWLKITIGRRGKAGMLCPKCKKGMQRRTQLMMGIDWECDHCDRRYATYDYEKNWILDMRQFDGAQ